MGEVSGGEIAVAVGAGGCLVVVMVVVVGVQVGDMGQQREREAAVEQA